jgi:hypothetical protein
MKNRASIFVILIVIMSFLAQGCGTASATESPQASTSQPAPPQPGGSPTIILHVSRPAIVTNVDLNFQDNDESSTFQDKDVKRGDQYKGNRFERPFTAGDMQYLPYVDLKDMGLTSDDTWYYVEMEMVGLGGGNTSLKGTYGAEFDADMDGHSEIIVLANPPFNTDWSTDGVSVYWDQNGDIGGSHLYPDPNYTGNGYETNVFNSEVGTDPDLAWARVMGTDKPVLELAFKRSIFANADAFMWDVLASANPVDPTQLYYNDTISPGKAGSPRKASEFYPLKSLWGFDNTCRFAFGFEETGQEPMACRSFGVAANGAASSSSSSSAGSSTMGSEGNSSSSTGSNDTDPPDVTLHAVDTTKVTIHVCPPGEDWEERLGRWGCVPQSLRP